MSNLRLSNESLMFYKRSKNNAMPHGFKPFVSFVHDKSDEESDNSDSDSILLTPRLKAHSRKMMESDEKVSGVTPLAGTIPVNLANRLSSSVPDSTPNRILSVALEQSVQNGFNGFDEEDTSHSTKKRYKKQQIENEQIMNGILTPESNDPIGCWKKGGRLQTKKKHVENPVSDKEQTESDMENSPQEPKITKRKPHVNRMANNKTTAKSGPKSSKTRKNQQKNDSPLANPKNVDESAELSDSENESIDSEDSPQKGTKANKKHLDSNNHTNNGKTAKSTIFKVPKSSKTRKNKQQKDESPIVPNTENIDVSTEEIESGNKKPKAKRGRKPKVNAKDSAEKKTSRSKLTENPHPSDLVAPAITGKRTNKRNIQTSNIDSTIDSVIESLYEQENIIDRSEHVTRRTARGKTTSKSFKNVFNENTVATKAGVDTTETTEKKPRGRGRPKKPVDVSTDGATVGESTSLAESPSKSNKLYLGKSPVKTTLPSGATEKALDDITEEQSESSSFEVEERIPQRNANRFRGIESDTSISVESDEEEDSIFSGRFPSRKIPSPKKLTTPLELYRSPIRDLPNGSASASATPKSSFKKQSVLISPRSIIPVPKRKVSLFMEPQPDKSTPRKSGIKDPKEVQVTPVTSRSMEKTKQSAKTPALKRKSSQGVSQTTSSANKRLRVLLNTSQQKSIEIDEGSDLVHAVAKRTAAASQIFRAGTALSSAIDPGTLPIPPGQPMRYPYMAPVEDPVRARLLMSTEKYRVSWLHLLPKCMFPLRVYSGMKLIRVEGNIEIRSDPFVPSNIVLNPSVQFVELDAGIICHILNTGDEVATFQTTEVLR